MSTIYVFQTECPAHSGAPLAADRFLMYNSSSGRTEYITAALMQESGRTVTAGTTLANLNAFGITLLQTTLGAFTLTDPTQAGQETTIIFPSSTGIKTVTTAAATIGGSTINSSSATIIAYTGTSDAVAGTITLIATSTAKWYIKGGTSAKTTLGAPIYITTS